MKTQTIIIPGKPQHWRRPLNRAGGGRRTDPVMAAAKRALAWEAKRSWTGPPIEGAFAMSAQFVFARPRKPGGLTHGQAPTTPDFDNLAKLPADALNKLVYVDDGQVCKALIEKRYAHDGEEPHSSVTVGPLEEWGTYCDKCGGVMDG